MFWEIQDRRQIQNTDNKTKHNPGNKTSLVHTPLMTLGQETRWAYSTMLPAHTGPITVSLIATNAVINQTQIHTVRDINSTTRPAAGIVWTSSEQISCYDDGSYHETTST